MRVVVMLAVHNQANSLRKCIDSVIQQTWPDWHLCVVDDGSTDGSGDVAAAGSPRVTVLRNECRMGLAASLNRIWRTLRADLYARIDADDVCLPDRLRQQIEYLERHPEVAVLGGGALVIGPDGEVAGCFRRPERHEELMAGLFRQNPFLHPTVIMRREFLEVTGGYDPTLWRAQDYDLWLRGAQYFRYANLSEPLIAYRCCARPAREAIYWGTVVLLRAARRRRLGWIGYWYAARYAIGALAIRWGWKAHPLLSRVEPHSMPLRRVA